MIIPILATLTVIIVTAILLKVVFARRLKGRRILLVGLSDAGKTLMFSQLHSGMKIMTQTSMKENKGLMSIEDGKKQAVVELVDVPGHERLRSQILEKNKQGVRGIIVVVDSVNFPTESRDVAELVYDMLADSTFCCYRVPLVVACNKQDMVTAKSANVIGSQLEKEMYCLLRDTAIISCNALRVTRSAALEGIDNTNVGSKNTFIGKEGKDFEFSQVSNSVSLIECSCKRNTGDEADLEAVKDWIKGVF